MFESFQKWKTLSFSLNLFGPNWPNSPFSFPFSFSFPRPKTPSPARYFFLSSGPAHPGRPLPQPTDRRGPPVGVAPDLPTEPDSSLSPTRPRASPLPSVARTPRHPAASIKGPADPPCPTQLQPPPSRANPSRRLCRELRAPRRATVPLRLLDDITAPELLCGESKPSDPFSLSFPLARVY